MQSQGQLTDWLQQHQLSDSKRLWQFLQVESGWEQAVEAVLGQRLNALVTEDWAVLQQLPTLPPARLWFMRPTEKEASFLSQVGLRPIAEVVKVQDLRWQATIEQALAGYYIASDLQTALTAITTVGPEVSFVVQEGHIVQAHQVLLYAADSEQAGILARQHAIEQQTKALQAQQLHVEAAQQHLQQSQSELEAIKQHHLSAQTRLQDLVQQTHELQLHYQQAEQRTQQQQQRERQLKNEILERGFPPTVREICQTVGLKSTSSVHSHLESLEKNGYIRRDPTKPRAIEILDDSFNMLRREMVNVPVVGTVAAGQPILAEQNIDSYFPIPAEYMPNEQSFILRVKGESMVNAGILDGDRVIVRQQSTAHNGDIVVALVDDSATVKTFYKENGHYRLQPENDTMDPIIVDDLQILGKVFGVFRFF